MSRDDATYNNVSWYNVKSLEKMSLIKDRGQTDRIPVYHAHRRRMSAAADFTAYATRAHATLQLLSSH